MWGKNQFTPPYLVGIRRGRVVSVVRDICLWCGGFGIEHVEFGPKSQRDNHGGVPLGKAHFLV